MWSPSRTGGFPPMAHKDQNDANIVVNGICTCFVKNK